MYWDVVEVKPEPEYRLFVRFKDGLTGRVRFEAEQLTGALKPLRAMQFFNRLYIELGAIASADREVKRSAACHRRFS